MADLQEFKCPNCDGKLEFDAGSQKMKCPFCDSFFDPETLGEKKQATEKPTEKNERLWEDARAQGIKTYVCKSCGGEILSDETTAATACPYCGNPVVLSDRLSGLLRPDVVIPFQVTKEQAIVTLKKHVKAKRYAPRMFSSEATLREIKGVYVPYWLFDSTVNADICFTATKTRYWHDSHYNYTETSYYEMDRAGKMRYEHVPVDGSKKMPDKLMDSLEPFDYSGAVDFNTAYLSGFFADKYDVDVDACKQHADERVENSATAELAGTVPSEYSIASKKASIQILPEKTTYALFPVWLLHTEYRGKTYTFAMNGQTGAFIGNVPVSKKRLAWLFGTVAACVSTGIFLLGLLTGLF